MCLKLITACVLVCVIQNVFAHILQKMLWFFTSTADIYAIFVYSRRNEYRDSKKFLIEKHFVLRLNLCQFRKVAPDLRNDVGRRAILKIILRDGGGGGGVGDC